MPGCSARSGGRLLYRDAGPTIAVTRSAQLEHRAYMLLMAAKAGVPVSEVVIAASGGREDTAAPRPRSTPTGDRSRSSTPTRSRTPRSTTRGPTSSGCTTPG